MQSVSATHSNDGSRRGLIEYVYTGPQHWGPQPILGLVFHLDNHCAELELALNRRVSHGADDNNRPIAHELFWSAEKRC